MGPGTAQVKTNMHGNNKHCISRQREPDSKVTFTRSVMGGGVSREGDVTDVRRSEQTGKHSFRCKTTKNFLYESVKYASISDYFWQSRGYGPKAAVYCGKWSQGEGGTRHHHTPWGGGLDSQGHTHTQSMLLLNLRLLRPCGASWLPEPCPSSSCSSSPGCRCACGSQQP